MPKSESNPNDETRNKFIAQSSQRTQRSRRKSKSKTFRCLFSVTSAQSHDSDLGIPAALAAGQRSTIHQIPRRHGEMRRVGRIRAEHSAAIVIERGDGDVGRIAGEVGGSRRVEVQRGDSRPAGGTMVE